MKLYKLKQSDYYTFFGTSKEKGGELIERDVTRVAQTPSCDAFLYLSNTTYDQLELFASEEYGQALSPSQVTDEFIKINKAINASLPIGAFSQFINEFLLIDYKQLVYRPP